MKAIPRRKAGTDIWNMCRSGTGKPYVEDMRMKRTRLVRILSLLAVITAVFAAFSAGAEEAEKNNSTSFIRSMKIEDTVWIECSTPMLYKGQEAVFTVVTGGKDDYTYRFELSGGENGEDYRGMSEVFWNFPVLLEETNTTGVLRYTPVLSSGIYLLEVYVSDTAGNEQKVQELYVGGDAADRDDPSTLTGKVAEIAAECRAMNYDNDYDIALFMHNWLLDNAYYVKSKNDAETYWTPDGILLRGTGVCESYAYAYHILMNEMGIPCLTVSGVAGREGHAWNMIELEGVWGHVDCTWDDTEHTLKYFFVSDEQMRKTRTWESKAYPGCGGFWELCGKHGHSFTEQHEATEPTCTEPGCNAWGVCEICGFSSYEELPPLGHHPVGGVCTNCGTDHIGEGDRGGLHWKLDLYGTLEFTGSGTLEPDWDSLSNDGPAYPWLAYTDQIMRVILPGDMTEIGDEMLCGCTGLTSVTIPDGVTYIGESAFCGTGLTSVTIPDGVTCIGEAAFFDTCLTSVTIPEGVTRIESDAFGDCEELAYISLPEGLTEIGEFAFSNTGFTSFTIPDGVTVIEEGVFYECALLSYVSLPSGLTEVSDHAFFNCESLCGIVIPDGTACIGGEAFAGCTELACITIPRSVTQIEYAAFDCCFSLRDVYYQGSIEDLKAVDLDDFNTELTDAVWHYGTMVYEDMSMLYLPASVTEVASEALAGTGAQVIVIPAACTSVAADAFDSCTDLVYIVNRSCAPVTAPQGVTVIDESHPAEEDGN
ncbi:MAG: hypothetical protein CW338_06115 [Clostridiales bacterium]|nr:hypothetical protein [Clostridiales bacterium]